MMSATSCVTCLWLGSWILGLGAEVCGGLAVFTIGSLLLLLQFGIFFWILQCCVFCFFTALVCPSYCRVTFGLGLWMHSVLLSLCYAPITAHILGSRVPEWWHGLYLELALCLAIADSCGLEQRVHWCSLDLGSGIPIVELQLGETCGAQQSCLK